MALNPFDDAVDELPAPPPLPQAAAPAPAANPFADVVREYRGEQDAKLRTTVLQGATQTPDRAAEARKYADRFGLPPSVVEHNFDTYKRKAALEDVSTVAQHAPSLGGWLAKDPSNAAVAQDDLPTLSNFDRLAGFARRTLADPAISLLQGAIGLPEAGVGLFDILSGGQVGKDLEERFGYQPELANKILSTYFSKAQQDATRTVADAEGMIATAVAALSNPSVIAHSVLQSAPLLLSGAATAALLPFLSPVLAGALGEGLQQAGSAAEQARFGNVAPPLASGQVTAGTVDLYGQPTVANADGTHSTVDSIGVNVDNQELLLPTVTPDGRHFAGTDEERVTQAIAEYRKTGQHLGVFASPEASTAYAQRLHEDYAAGKYATVSPPAPGLISGKQAFFAAASGAVDVAISAFGGKLAARMGFADVDTLIAGGAVNAKARRGLVAQVLFGAVEEGFVEELPQSVQEQLFQNAAAGRPLSEGVDEAAVLGAFAGAVMGGGANLHEHVQEHFLHAVGELAKESKTIARDPAAAQDFLALAMKDGPEHVYAPMDTFTTYWQGQGQDPAAIAAALTGDPDAYPTALAQHDADLVIPTARYITQLAGTAHHAFFEQELRVSPELQNKREQAAYEAEQAAAETDQPAAVPTPREQMRTALTEQLTTAGYLPRDAEANARLVEAAFGTMAEAAGEDPFQVLRDRGLEVTRPDLDAARRSAGPTRVDQAAAPAAPPTAAQRITQLEGDLRAATRAADVDALTGVANRAALDKALPTAEADPETHVVVFDANHFGQVNKLAGHEAGDAMLQQMSAAITQAATEFGVGGRVFRRGGDEFVVLAPAGVADQVRARAEDLFGQHPIESDAWFLSEPAPVVSLSGTSANTFHEADATLQAAKTATKAARQEVHVETPIESLQRTGVAYGPGGLRVRVVPTSGPDGEFELEITEKGRRTFEGTFSPLEAAQRAGADRLSELVKHPTPAIVTPQIEAPAAAAPLPTPDEAPIVEEVGSDETPAGGPRVVDGGRPAGPGDTGGSVGRPGDTRAADLAGEQPGPREAIPPKPRAPRGPRKRRPAASPSSVGGGAPVTVAGFDSGAGAGGHAASHVDTADLAPDADVAAAEARGEAPRRFTIDNTASLTEGGWSAKLADNVAAIRLLKVLQRESRLATDAEQAVLARYIGWGHTDLKDVVEFEGGPSTLAQRDPRKQKARDELDSLLTREELQELGESTPNAHYSFADLPRAMWTAVQRLGFRGGSILEPAVGIGHFLGTMPGAIVAAKQTRVFAVEKEPIAAAIARQLFQDTHVQTSPLQDANLPTNYYDLQISNVPFGRIAIFDPDFHTTAERRQLDKVHNYYFGKALDTARPGGIVAFVTSRYTMDARSDGIRSFLAKGFNLLGAVRLPDQAFKATAGTDVVTDILFLQKRAPGEAASGPAWTQSPLHEGLSEKSYAGEITNPIHQNEYFQANPQHVLGTQNLSGSMARTNVPQYNVQGSLTLDQLVAGLTKALPANVYKPSTAAPRQLAAVISRDVKQGAFQVDGGKLFLYDKGTLAPSDLTGRPLDVAKAFVPLRDTYQGVLDTMVRGGTDAELKHAQQALLGTYKFFVASFGLVNEEKNRHVIEQDPNAGRIVALENVEVVRKKGKRAEIKLLGYADIFTKRTFRPVIEATTADSPAAALTQSLAWKGAVNLPYMAALTGQTETDLVAALGTELYRNPVTLAYEPKAEYLSGDVTTKLAQAQVAALDDAAYTDNATALMAVLPTQFTAEDFPAPFGATWVPANVYARFIQAEMRGSGADVRLVNGETRVKWYVEGGFGKHEFLPEGANAMEWAAHALNGELPVLNSGKPPTRDEALTETYRESLKQLRERWAEWWPTDPEASDKIVKIYNGMFNRDAAYVADGSHLVLAGSNPAIKFRFWQKNVVWRALQVGNTLIAHAVGAGKTFAMIGIAAEWKRLGLANKPLIVVPNHLTQQWQDSFTELYPAARVLMPTKEDFKPANRKRLMAMIANNDWDAVVMAQSHFLRVSVKIETLKAFIKEQEDQMLADGAQQMNMSTEDFQTLVTDYGAGDKAATQALSARNAPRSVKDIARGILTLRARLQKRLNQAGKDAPVNFEELGVDGLLVDEAHLYKNLYFSTAMNGIAGLKGSDSDRAMDMFLKVRQINQQSKGRNVIFATGTPVSNTLSELFTVFRYLAQPTLDRMGMSGFDSWAHGNAEASAEMEKAAGTGYKERTRLRSWTNLRELSAQFRKFADVLTTDDLIASGAVTIPKRKGGAPTVIALDPHPDMPAFMDEIDARIEALKTGNVDPKDDNHLLITTHAAMAAIDMRLVKPEAAADPNGRIPTAAIEIATRYKASKATKGTQIVFLDIGIPDGKSMPPLPRSVTNGPVVELAEPEHEEADPDLVDPEAEADAAMAEILAAGHARDLYSDLRQRLVAQGIKDDEIAYVHQARTPQELGQLFAAVNDGRIRVLLASTAKGATGMNVQTKLMAIHHLDVPWRPADVEQRNGRIFRQGNENAEAEEVRYVTKKSFDEYRWAVLATKQQGIVALMKGTLTSMDDVDPGQLDYEVASALANGDPRALDLLNKERQIKALRTRYQAYTRRINAAKRTMAAGVDAIETLTARGAAVGETLADAQTWAETRQLTLVNRANGYSGQASGEQTYDLGDTESRKALQARVETLMTAEPYRDSVDIGEAGPYRIVLNKTEMDVLAGNERTTQRGYFLTVKAQVGDELLVIGSTPTWQVGAEFPSFTRSLDFHLDPKKLAKLADQTADTLRQWQESIAADTAIAAKPFAQLDQLHQAEAELTALRGSLAGAPPAADAAPPDDTKSFDQPAPDGRRGNVTFDTHPLTGRPRTTITLPPNADLSTFLHESAHVFLEVFGDLVDKVRARDPQTLTHQQEGLLADYDALLQELGVPDRAHIETAQHEQFATQFERYLMQGEAPSIELQSAFARFRGWLLDIYRALRNIGTPLSPELKGIFDRMLASEDEIDAAERDAPPLFTTAEQAGMTPARFAVYRTAAEDAHRVTREQLDRQITKEVAAERSATRQAQRTEIAATVTTALQAEPVYRALEAMRTGMTPEGASLLEGSDAVPLQLARAPLVAEFGEDRVNALPAGIVSTTEGGTSASLVASVFGFGSGDELLQAVTAAPPLAAAVAAETERRMQTEHSSMLTDGTLRDRARAAVANTDRDALIRAEVKALWQKHEQTQRAYERRWFEAEAKLRIAIAEGYKQVEIDTLTQVVQDLKAKARGGAAAMRRALPSAKTLQAAAEARVARTKIRDLRPTLFWTAARAAAKKAIALAATQDIAGAIAQKTAELTNLANHRATVAALTDSHERLAWVKDHDTTAARGRTGLAGADYLDQWDGMLDRFEFKQVSRKVLDRRTLLKTWIEGQEAAGLPVLLPAIVLNDALTVNYQSLTVEQFVGVTDGLKALMHLARLKLGLMRKGERRAFEDVRDEIADSIRAKSPVKPIPIEFRPAEAKWRALENAVASHATLSTFGFQLDGNSYNGPFWEHIVRPANEAAAAEETRNIAAGTDYHAILERHYPGREVLQFGDQVFIPAITKSLSKEARLSIAFLMGSDSGKARVLSDPSLHWSPTQLAAVLDTLDKRDWDFVQDHWDYLNTYWPEIAAKRERLTGLPPEKVEAVPVDTKFGTYAGGYSPIVYDWRKSSEVGQTLAVSEAKLAVAGAAMYATTKRGHEETRLQHVELPIRLDMTATSMHLSQVIHDLTHHEFLIDATRLLRDKAVAAAIHATRGPLVQQKLAKILLDIATGDRAPGGRPTFIENGSAWLRTRTQVAGLAWNLWTMLQQPLGIFNGMERVGIGWVAKGAGLWARDAVTMEHTVQMVLDKSDMMRARYGTATQDLHDLRQTLSAEGGWFDRLVRTVSADHATQQTILDSYMWFIHFGQMFADKPTWLGEYLKQMDGDPLDEPRAIAAADQAVLDSQGGGQIKDLAEVQRGGQVAKLFMVFASYSTMILNSTARAAGQTNFRSPASALTFAGHLAMLYAIPALFTETLRCGVGRARCDEVPQFLGRVGGQSLSTALNGVLFLREGVAEVNLLLGQETGARGYAGPAGTRVFEVMNQLATQAAQGHWDKGLERAAFAASGILFRYPAAQVQRSVDGWIALEEGRTHNPAALLMGPPPKTQSRR